MYLFKVKKLLVTSLASILLTSSILTPSISADSHTLSKSSMREMLQFEFSNEKISSDREDLANALSYTYENLDLIFSGMKEDEGLRNAYLDKASVDQELRESLENYLSSPENADDERELTNLVREVKAQISENSAILPELTDVLVSQNNSIIGNEEKVQPMVIAIILRFALKEAVKKKMGNKIRKMAYDEFEERVEEEIWSEVEALHKQYNGDIDYEGPESSSARNGINQGEKVFNIFNKKTKKDLLRFHVRKRDNDRSIEFHWHKSDDNFEWHHGQIKITRNNQFPKYWGED
ncbi:YpjP family protein [Brevibacillus agri]|uniref:YpjP family protein n=1 Tax=Brevibacillus agri TaxID=51101 RepID=UPI003D259B23